MRSGMVSEPLDYDQGPVWQYPSFLCLGVHHQVVIMRNSKAMIRIPKKIGTISWGYSLPKHAVLGPFWAYFGV